MNGGSGWGEGSAGHGAGRTGRGGGAGALSALARCWAVGAVVHVIAAYVISHGLVDLLATGERLDVFAWRLALQHVPAVLTTVLTVLAAARVLPAEQRASRPLYLSAALGVPLAALGYGYAVLWQLPGMEAVLMPVVTLATGAAVGLAVDRLMDDDADTPPAAPYYWRDGGATATGYVGGILVAAGMVAALATAGVVG